MRNIRNISIISIIALSILVFIFKPFPFSRLPFFPISAFEAVPANAGLVLEFNHLERFRKTVDTLAYAHELDKQFVFRQLNEDLEFLEQLTEADSLKNQLLLKSPLLANLQSSGADELHYLFILESPSKSMATDFTYFLCSQPAVNILSSNFKNKKVYDLKDKSGNTVSVSAFRNLVLLSKYPLLIEDAIEQLKSMQRQPLSKWNFHKNRSGQQQAFRIYSKPSGLAMLSLPFLNRKGKKQIQTYKSWEDWVGLDVYLNQEGMRLEGQVNSTGRGLLQSVIQEKPGDRESIVGILPDNLAMMSWLGFDDLSAYTDGGGVQVNETFEEYFYPWLGNHLAYVITEPYSTKIDAERFLLCSVKDPDRATEYLEKLSEAEGELDAFNYMTYDIRRVMTADLVESPLWSGSTFKNPYFVFIEDYLILSQSQQALEVWIDKYLSGQVLSKQAAFLAYHQQLSKQANFWQHIQFSNSKQLFRNIVRPEFLSALENEFAISSNFYPIGFEINKGGRVHGFIQHQAAAATANTSVLWKTRLQDEIVQAPTVVFNPSSKSKEIWVQDNTNVLYVLNNEGEELWRRKLDGALLSEIHVLDFYQKNDPHFLFNTAGKIYIVNNKGLDVGSFPIRLQSKATNGVVAIDFDDRGQYRFFVACRNGNIYGFEKTGRPVPGWNPQSSVGKIKFPIKHFQHGGNDFVIALNTKGKLYVFNKEGKRRFNSIRFDEKFISPPAFDAHETSPRIVAVNHMGQAKIVNLEGKTFKLDLGFKAVTDVQFAFADIAGDDRKDYIAMSGDQLKGYYYKDSSFEPLFDEKLKQKADEVFTVEMPGQQKAFIGTLSKDKKQISLFDGSGQIVNDFPLAGSTQFEVARIFRNRENILIVGNGKNVYAYRLR